ncbi:MAG: hypothetical protein ACREJC_05915 [Tepidisphaeraceae bacterium]
MNPICKLWRFAIDGNRVDDVIFKVVAFLILTPVIGVIYICYLVDIHCNPEDS